MIACVCVCYPGLFHAACQIVLSKVSFFNWIVPPGAAQTTAALHFDFLKFALKWMCSIFLLFLCLLTVLARVFIRFGMVTGCGNRRIHFYIICRYAVVTSHTK